MGTMKKKEKGKIQIQTDVLKYTSLSVWGQIRVHLLVHLGQRKEPRVSLVSGKADQLLCHHPALTSVDVSCTMASLPTPRFIASVKLNKPTGSGPPRWMFGLLQCMAQASIRRTSTGAYTEVSAHSWWGKGQTDIFLMWQKEKKMSGHKSKQHPALALCFSAFCFSPMGRSRVRWWDQQSDPPASSSVEIRQCSSQHEQKHPFQFHSALCVQFSKPNLRRQEGSHSVMLQQ